MVAAQDDARSTERLARFTMLALGARTCFTAINLVLNVGSRLHARAGSEPLDLREAIAADHLVRVILATLLAASFLASAVGWCAWLASATRLARERFGETGLPSTRRLIAAYLIPFVCYVRPKAHMVALFEASDPDRSAEVVDYQSKTGDYRTSPREEVARARWQVWTPIGAWWAAWIVNVLGLVILGFLRLPDGSRGPTLTAGEVNQAVAGLQAFPFVLAIFVIRGMTLRQRERLRRVVRSPEPPDDDTEEERRPRRARR